MRLKLEVAREILGIDRACAVFELERGVKRVIDLFDESDQRSDVTIAQSGAWIMLLELFDHPARIINADVEPIIGSSQECARELAQFTRGFTGQDRQVPATMTIDQAIFEIDPDLRVGALEKFLDLTKERLVHRINAGLASSSRWRRRSESSLSASRTS